MADKRCVLWAQFTVDGKIIGTTRGSTESEAWAKLGWERIKEDIEFHTRPVGSEFTTKGDNDETRE